MNLTVGIKGHAECIVTEALTAETVGSGALRVFATPAMCALMEEAAWRSVQPYLEEGWGSVGISLTVSHDAATPVGMKVWADSELTAVDGRKLTFSVTAYDEAGKIGHCEQQRFLVQNDKFFAKCSAKLN